MDEIARLITMFGSRGKHDQSRWKIDILIDLGRLDNPRIVRFLIDVVGDNEEPTDVRSDALRRLRHVARTSDERELVVKAARQALAPDADCELRLSAVVVLGTFITVDDALSALGAVVSDPQEPLDLRYDAFTSLQRAGPTPTCIDILRALTADETFGQSAQSLLASWRVR